MHRPGNTAVDTATTIVMADQAEISSYERIAKILICLSKGTSSVTEIARECNMKVPTVHRLLKSLTRPRFTAYDAVNHRYFLGPLIAQVSSNASTNHQYLRMCTMKEMKRLSDKHGETVTLTVLIGSEFTQIGSINCKHDLMVQGLKEETQNGLPLSPLGATQKTLLSQLEDANLNHLLNSMKGENQRPFGTAEVLTEIAKIRELGYAISSGEIISGATCLCCPINNYFFPASLSIIGPKTRLSKKIPGLLKSLKESTKTISEVLVYENILTNKK
jgi:IclR family transcriptional regulator, acetate operon repressor